MSSEWFYMCRWQENKKRNWVVVDLTEKIILESELTHFEASLLCEQHKRVNKKVMVVNMKDDYYNEYKRNTELK